MKTLNRIAISLSILSAGFVQALAQSSAPYKLESPSGAVSVSVSVTDDKQLQYEVTYHGETIVEPSLLGLKIGTLELSTFTRSIEASYDKISETYTLPHGKVSTYSNECNEMTLDCQGRADRRMKIVFRAYDDGIAFRYGLDNRKGSKLTGELTQFNIKTFDNSWAQRYHKDYSWYYEPRTWENLTDTEGYCVPMLIKSADTYVLLTEAANFAIMSASRLVPGTQSRQLMLSPMAESTIIDDATLLPWRAMIIGSLPTIVESTMLTNLAPPTRMTATDWIKPGRVSWNWGAEDGDSAPTLEQAKRYIDLARYYGWEYFLLDDGWDGRINLSEVADYADSQGVDLLLWSHQNRFTNDKAQCAGIFDEWSKIGIKGAKIDFFEDDSQGMLSKYEAILEAAAEHEMMINFHGCTKPSGLQRYWPHLMTSEAVLGGEFYMFNSTMTPGSHTVNLALTRNVLGAMDYTPVKYGNKNGRAITNTTWAYQTALAVAFESSLQCFCDCPANMMYSIAEPLLRALPVTWDETKCLEALPDEYVTLARRKGGDWWLATLTSKSRQAVLDLSFLPAGKQYYAYIYTEGKHATDIAFEYREQVDASSKIELQLRGNSGASVILSENPGLIIPTTLKREAENYNLRGNKTANAICSGGYCISGLKSSRKKVLFDDITVDKAGIYALTLFYLDTENHSAYIQVNDGDKEYHQFTSPSAGNLAFKTILVSLKEGVNTIAYGNDNDMAPSLDRVTVTSFGSKGGDSGIDEVVSDATAPVIEVSGNRLTVSSFLPGTVNVFGMDGLLLQSETLPSGQAQYEIDRVGPVIINVVCGSMSSSKKVIITQ